VKSTLLGTQHPRKEKEAALKIPSSLPKSNRIHRAAHAADARKSDERAADDATFLDSIN
jgi:hypothetical protein